MRQDFLLAPNIGSRTLVIAFTSYGGHAVPAGSFEWVTIVTKFGVDAIFFRDSFQHWYHGPCRGFSDSLEHTLLKLQSHIRQNGIERVITMGSSMGGHGALLFGSLLAADHIITFVPQVNMDAQWLFANDDKRWEWKATQMNHVDYDHLNLAHLLQTSRPKETLIYYDSSVPLDQLHASTISTVPGIKTWDLKSGGHEVAYDMAKSGEVTRVLRDRII